MATRINRVAGRHGGFLSDSAGIQPHQIDLVYASSTAFLAAKSAKGNNSASAEEGDCFYDSTRNCLRVYDGSQWLDVAGAQSLSNTAADILQGDRAWSEDFNAYATTDQVVSLVAATGAIWSGATGVLHNLHTRDGKNLNCFPLGAGQTLAPAIVAAGLDIGCDQTSTEGIELTSHCLFGTGAPFVIGTSPAFYFLCKLEIADVSGVNPLGVGFRKVQAVQGTLVDYTDKASLGCTTAANPMAVKISTALNNGADTVTDTTQTLADATAVQFKILVSAAGVVTYQHDLATPGTLAAPAATAAFTFDTGDQVIPFVHFLNAADLCDSVVIHKWEVGYQ